MITLIRLALIFLLCGTSFADSPDMKRNKKVQKLAEKLISVQRLYDTEVQSWVAYCESKNLQLMRIADNLMDCMQKPTPPAQPKPQPKKEAK